MSAFEINKMRNSDTNNQPKNKAWKTFARVFFLNSVNVAEIHRLHKPACIKLN